MKFDDKNFGLWVCPEINDTLKPTTPIYRIIDFFSAAKLIRKLLLFVPLATRFSDANEGIDQSLTSHATTSGPCAGMVGRHFQSKQDLIAHHTKEKESNYISCWTQQRESVAMWALYSEDHCSVQVATTIGQLYDAFNTLARNEYNPFTLSLDNDEQRNIVISAHVMPVKYVSLLDIGKQIDRRRRAYDKLEKL
jgi:hypothetical protein